MDENIKIHSIKVPQTYKDVSKILQKVVEEGKGLKNIIYKHDAKVNRNKQRNLALATKILSKYRTIEHILTSTNILKLESKLDPWLARVFIHELIWRKDLNHACTPAQIIISYKKQILDAYEEVSDSVEPIIKACICEKTATK